MLQHYCYLFSSLVSTFIFLAIRRNSSVLRQIISPVLIFVITYFFVYHQPIGEINSLLLSIVLPFEILVISIFLTSAKEIKAINYESLKRKKNLVVLGTCFLFELLSLFVVFAFPWVKNTFSIDNAEAVIFTLKMSKDGAWGAVYHSFSQDVLPSLICSIFLGWVLVALFFFTLKNKSVELKFLKRKIIVGNSCELKTFLIGHLIFFVVSFSLAIMSMPVLGYSAIDVYKTYTKEKKFVNSDLYKKYYADPDTVTIDFKKKKNLIFIMLESMGTNHIHFLPELKKIQENYLSFVPGGVSPASQGWTIGSQVNKYCGVPLKLPVYENIERFMPNAVCIQDVLNKHGYNQLFVQGTDKKFTSFGKFIETHSNIEMHDHSYFLKSKRAKTDIGSWGVDDFTLFELLKEDLTKISKDSLPFAVYAMTMDTHWPSGYISKQCGDDINDVENKKEKYKRVLACASKNMDNFLEWAKQQVWFDNTVIVIQGDHVVPQQIRTLLDFSVEEPSLWYNVFINVAGSFNENRMFTSFDVFPSVLEAIGARIEGHRLALGTSLFAEDSIPTSIELLGTFRLDSLVLLDDYMDLFFMGMEDKP